MNTQTGEVIFISVLDSIYDEQDAQPEDIEENDDIYLPIESIPSREAYLWMRAFVDQLVAPQNEQAAEKLSLALMGKGAFRRFKAVLSSMGETWIQAWYQWRDERLYEAIKAWLMGLPFPIIQE
ncbi:UPF0158 family protein [Ktedonospora formicarum]|uniref:Uncharacterized protein n=1 Tax=Ktedonospora formicarum TaxID=2778364 RepID=A0A8J3I6X0_9CHLR|nr:UPF0158 family protein [Ktedonospora formicarum]GHO47152.1 hypothetical protein KSX_53150 [Ktedonospora formicarum]